MIEASGVVKIVGGPYYDLVDSHGGGAYLVVESGKVQLELVATNYLMTESLRPLQTGHTVHFTGYLREEKPGEYVVCLREIRRTKRS